MARFGITWIRSEVSLGNRTATLSDSDVFSVQYNLLHCFVYESKIFADDIEFCMTYMI